MNALVELLQQEAKIQPVMPGKILNPAGFVLKYGQPWRWEGENPKGYRHRRTPKACWKNAAVAAWTHSELVYVEGYFLMRDLGILIPHAWNVLPVENNRVVDQTTLRGAIREEAISKYVKAQIDGEPRDWSGQKPRTGRSGPRKLAEEITEYFGVAFDSTYLARQATRERRLGFGGLIDDSENRWPLLSPGIFRGHFAYSKEATS